uniref:BAR domain-containing protein n=1 Tax=Amphilophus citrinellus TaxID=61819 RepID=A0A3Q0R4P0_AMPCI
DVMDLTRLAVDAGQFINRAVQYTGESLGQAEKTELDSGLEELLAQADATKTWTDQIISQTEVLLQPSLGVRLEDRLYQHLEWSIPPRPRAIELLGDQMTQAGLEFGSNTPYGTALIRCGEAQKQLGEAERKLVQSTNIHFLTPLRSFTEGEYKVIENERKILVNKRLDLDIAKARLRKAHEADQETRAEMELRICQSLFDRQSEITRRVVEGLSNTHTNHMRSLTDFVDAQACHFAQCSQHAQALQKQLASIPAVFCSNNWQSAISNPINRPSTSNHEANEPTRLNHITPLPVAINQLPDFDQDSWTLNSPPQTVNTTNSSSTALLTDQTNNNNNNIITSTVSQTPSNRSPINSQSATNQTIGHVSTPNQTDPFQAPSRTVRMAVASTQAPTFSTAASPPSQTSATSGINGGDVQEPSSGSRDVVQ